VGTGSRQENASNQKSGARSDSIGTEKALGSGENIVQPLFVHEYRCMAALGGQGHTNYIIKSGDKGVPARQ
jgi:hypothetical protein